ncbi:MAG TPA: archaeosortase A [Methanothrix sp.]|nr:archaeosortase A [Methanothrix sp.]HOK58573.1 archaeosortase A [Methanothrix sp.]HOL43794.1 archaeosortase A [Methanothrix sp.]HPO88879.1 archaeosortase A [Methanothrix sp.]
MTGGILWLSLILLLISSVTRRSGISSAGWVLLGAYWLMEAWHYTSIRDYFNVIVVVGAAAISFSFGWRILSGGMSETAEWISMAAAICGLLYFPFAEVRSLSEILIRWTTLLTFWLLAGLNVPVSMESWNLLALNGRSVEIVLACTAIESIALFAGVILSVRAPRARRLGALTLSTAAIYTLNIGRNAFVLLAYGEEWFGQDSFYLAHNVIAKVGSTLVLLLIAYMVFAILPELLVLIDDLFAELRASRRPEV